MRTDLTPIEEAFAAQRARVFARLDPRLWRLVADGADGQLWALGPTSDMRVIWSVAEEVDGRVWLHVSASRPDRLPSYLDMQRVHALFVGEERYSYAVNAPAAKHVNIHEHCLHVWAVLDGDEPLPDFTRGGESI